MPRSKGFLHTYSGHKFYPLAPRWEDIDIRDIAHGLSLQARFGGQSRDFYCVPPESRVLTGNLEWVPAGDLSLGDSLFSPESAGPAGENGRKARRRAEMSLVTHTGSIVRNRVLLELEDGSTITSSSDHPWLCSTKMSGNQVWRRASDILLDVNEGRARNINRYLDTWGGRAAGWESGYISGLLDGEGCVSFQGGGVGRVTFTQNSGGVLDRMTTLLGDRGVRYTLAKNPSSGVMCVSILGGWANTLRFLGEYRPQRLIDNWNKRMSTSVTLPELCAKERLKVVSARDIGPGEVIALSTSSRTYFAEGFAAHNSVAEHSVRVSLACSPETQFSGLLHDSSEAYLGDIPSPIKHSSGFKAYRDAEDRLMEMIADKYRFSWPPPEEVKDADLILLNTEARDIFPSEVAWADPLNTLPERIYPVSPDVAERWFLAEFNKWRTIW